MLLPPPQQSTGPLLECCCLQLLLLPAPLQCVPSITGCVGGCAPGGKICLACASGRYLIAAASTSACPLCSAAPLLGAQCKTCSSATTCTSCLAGSYLNALGRGCKPVSGVLWVLDSAGRAAAPRHRGGCSRSARLHTSSSTLGHSPHCFCLLGAAQSRGRLPAHPLVSSGSK